MLLVCFLLLKVQQHFSIVPSWHMFSLQSFSAGVGCRGESGGGFKGSG